MESLDFVFGPLLLVAFPIALLGILIVIAPDGVDLDHIVSPDLGNEWPNGVREEEPVRWNLERLSPPRRSEPMPETAGNPASAGRPGLEQSSGRA